MGSSDIEVRIEVAYIGGLKKVSLSRTNMAVKS
jgi:hypothetical protein